MYAFISFFGAVLILYFSSRLYVRMTTQAGSNSNMGSSVDPNYNDRSLPTGVRGAGSTQPSQPVTMFVPAEDMVALPTAVPPMPRPVVVNL
jgi:hypothetical protein